MPGPRLLLPLLLAALAAGCPVQETDDDDSSGPAEAWVPEVPDCPQRIRVVLDDGTELPEAQFAYQESGLNMEDPPGAPWDWFTSAFGEQLFGGSHVYFSAPYNDSDPPVYLSTELYETTVRFVDWEELWPEALDDLDPLLWGSFEWVDEAPEGLPAPGVIEIDYADEWHETGEVRFRGLLRKGETRLGLAGCIDARFVDAR